MKLVEPEAEGPIEGEEAIVTPPRPPHRRVSVSFLFTLTVLAGTVVAIYLVFPARHNVLVTEAIDRHRDEDPQWDLTAPTPTELHAWAIGVVGKGVPLPDGTMKIVGARQIDVLDRRAAVVRLSIGADEITYLVQHARGMVPKRADRIEGDLRAISWRAGKFTVVAVGPAATADGWTPVVAKR